MMCDVYIFVLCPSGISAQGPSTQVFLNNISQKHFAVPAMQVREKNSPCKKVYTDKELLCYSVNCFLDMERDAFFCRDTVWMQISSRCAESKGLRVNASLAGLWAVDCSSMRKKLCKAAAFMVWVSWQCQLQMSVAILFNLPLSEKCPSVSL